MTSSSLYLLSSCYCTPTHLAEISFSDALGCSFSFLLSSLPSTPCFLHLEVAYLLFPLSVPSAQSAAWAPLSSSSYSSFPFFLSPSHSSPTSTAQNLFVAWNLQTYTRTHARGVGVGRATRERVRAQTTKANSKDYVLVSARWNRGLFIIKKSSAYICVPELTATLHETPRAKGTPFTKLSWREEECDQPHRLRATLS